MHHAILLFNSKKSERKLNRTVERQNLPEIKCDEKMMSSSRTDGGNREFGKRRWKRNHDQTVQVEGGGYVREAAFHCFTASPLTDTLTSWSQFPHCRDLCAVTH